MEITAEELERRNPADCLILDIRGEQARQYGAIPGSVAARPDALCAQIDAGEKRKIVVYCTRGELSIPAAQELEAAGYAACSLAGG